MRIYPKCGTWIDAGEPCCPYCLYDPRRDYEQEPFNDYDEKVLKQDVFDVGEYFITIMKQ